MVYVSMVFAEAERQLARDLGNYLERNCPVRIDYTYVIDQEHPLTEAVGAGLSADAMILLVSPASVQRRLDRLEWEPLFVDAAREYGTAIAYVYVADCDFPKALLRNNAFDPSPSVLECSRALKRWIFDLRPVAGRPFHLPEGAPDSISHELFESFSQQISDQPGSLELASAGLARTFVTMSQADFEGVLWVDAVGATAECVAGEFGVQLGMRLAGDLQANLDSIRRLCLQYRCLLVLEGASSQVVETFRKLGRTSVVFVPGPELPPMSIESALLQLADLSAWVTNPGAPPASGRLYRTLQWLLEDDKNWSLACEFARASAAYFKFQERLAEAHLFLRPIAMKAVERSDRRAVREFGKELNWLLETWGQPVLEFAELAPEPEPATQLELW